MWDIVSAERENGSHLKITGFDRLNRLNTPLNDDTVGIIRMESALKKVAKSANVEFAQTIDELREIFGNAVNSSGLTFLETCWDEVRSIAKFLGGFAFANRQGQIEFRKFGKKSVLTIPRDKRFSVKISDFPYSVRGVSYTDEYGNTVTRSTNTDNSAILGFSDCKYIWGTHELDRIEIQYGGALERIAEELGNLGSWRSGTVKYYGNPTLDVGDMITLEDVDGSEQKFLITQISWQFRGPQTLISGGFPEIGTSVSSGSGGSSGSSVTAYTTVNTTPDINVVEMKKYCGEIHGEEHTAAKISFSGSRESWIFLDFTAILTGDGLISAEIFLDDTAQNFRPKITLHNGGFSTLHFSFTIRISGGKHNIHIGIHGITEIHDIQAFLWGQGIREQSPEITDESDYIYTIDNGVTTVTGYVGESLFPQIPDDLGGGKTQYIGENSFSESKIESVYIPDGVTEIR